MLYPEPIGHKIRSPKVPNAVHLPRLKRRGRLVMPIGLLEEVLDKDGYLISALGRDGESVFLLKVFEKKDRPEELSIAAWGFIKQKAHQTNNVSTESYEVNVVVGKRSLNLPTGRWLGLDRLYMKGGFVGFRLYYIPVDGASVEVVKKPEIEQKIIIRPLEIGWPLVWPNGGYISFHDMRRALRTDKVLEVGLCTLQQDLEFHDNEEEDEDEEEE